MPSATNPYTTGWLTNTGFDGVNYDVFGVSAGTKIHFLFGLESGDYNLTLRDLFALNHLTTQIKKKLGRKMFLDDMEYLFYETPLTHNHNKKMIIAYRNTANNQDFTLNHELKQFIWDICEEDKIK